MKLNVDGHCGGGGLIRNHLCEVLVAFSVGFKPRMNSEAKLGVVRDDIVLCCEFGFQHVDIECNSSLVVKCYLHTLVRFGMYETIGMP